MIRKPKKPAIVAELGRPETPEETRARKERDSKLYRQRKTVNNLVLSLLVSLGLLAVMVAIVPRGTGTYLQQNVDVAKIASTLPPTTGVPFATPKTPDGWLAKQAETRYSKADSVNYWYIGYTTPSMNYVAIKQSYLAGTKATPNTNKWVATELENKADTGKVTLGGHEWTEYSHLDDSPDGSNVRYGLVTEIDGSVLIVSGTDSKEAISEFAQAARASIAEKMQAKGGS